MPNSLLFLGLLIIAVLAAIAGYLHWRLYQQRRQQEILEQDYQAELQAGRKQINTSLQIICRALLEGQVEYAEASVRVSYLLNQLNVDGEARADFVAFDKMAAAIKHIPILDQWRDLEKRKKREYQKQIAFHEEELGDFIKDSARKMLGREF